MTILSIPVLFYAIPIIVLSFPTLFCTIPIVILSFPTLLFPSPIGFYGFPITLLSFPKGFHVFPVIPQNKKPRLSKETGFLMQLNNNYPKATLAKPVTVKLGSTVLM